METIKKLKIGRTSIFRELGVKWKKLVLNYCQWQVEYTGKKLCVPDLE